MRMFVGLCVLLFFGFAVFVAMVGAGMLIGFVLVTFTWWQMVIGTLISTVVVAIHLLYPSEKVEE